MEERSREAFEDLRERYLRSVAGGAESDDALEECMDCLANNEECVHALVGAGLADEAVSAVFEDLCALVVEGDVPTRSVVGPYGGFRRAVCSLKEIHCVYLRAIEEGATTREALDTALDYATDEDRLYAVWGAGLLQDAFLAKYEDMKGSLCEWQGMPVLDPAEARDAVAQIESRRSRTVASL